MRRHVEQLKVGQVVFDFAPSHTRGTQLFRIMRISCRPHRSVQVYRQPEIEDDLTNFELLNMSAASSARDMWDTFHTTNARLCCCGRTLHPARST